MALPGTPSFFIAWGGVLAYTFQLYFDFSGYSDMAIGLSRMFGVRLPLNFNSPYKSVSISEFWRRWHMTLSRFLRDYLYIALGGNRRGRVRRYANLLITMLLGGLWHGAGWTYVVWGGLHGIYLVINHGWQALRERMGYEKPGAVWRIFAAIITFLAVVLSWVFFRAITFGDAIVIVRGMTGEFGVSLPQAIVAQLGSLTDVLHSIGVTTYLGGGQRFIEVYAWVIFAALIAFLAPNTQQIAARFEPALGFHSADSTSPVFPVRWAPTLAWALCIGVLGAVCILALNRPTEFLYFQF